MENHSFFFRFFIGTMALRVPFFETNRCLKKIRAHGLPLTYDHLAAHHRIGGRISSWVDGLIYAKKRGLMLDVNNAAMRDLTGAQGSKITLTEHLRILEDAGYHDAFKAPIDSLQINQPNNSLAPTPGSVMPAADAPVAPDAGAAHVTFGKR